MKFHPHLNAFLHDYQKGDVLAAFDGFFQKFPGSYQYLEPYLEKNEASRALIQMIDACTFGNLLDAAIAMEHFKKVGGKGPWQEPLERDLLAIKMHLKASDLLVSDYEMGSLIISRKDFIAYFTNEMTKEFAKLNYSQLEQKLSKEWIESALLESRGKWIPDRSTPFLKRQQEIANGTLLFKEKRALLWESLAKNHDLTRPYIPIALRSRQVAAPTKKRVWIYMESLAIDWASLNLVDKTLALIFANPNALMRCLQDPHVAQLAAKTDTLCYFLSLPPEEQLPLQIAPLPADFETLNLSPASALKEGMEPLEALLKRAFAGDETSFMPLYRLSREIEERMEAERLGKGCHLALKTTKDAIRWRDRYKAEGDPDCLLPRDLLAEGLPEKRHSKRRSVNRQRPMITHVVPQVVEGGHAPSRLLSLMMEQHDQEQFAISLLSTERSLFRPQEYPYNYYASSHSGLRGRDRLKSFQRKGVQVYLEDGSLSYLDTAKRVAKNLQLLGTDIAIFHGPDAINLAAARLSDCPLNVCFEHGTLPKQSGFDLVISSQHDSKERFADLFAKMDTDLIAKPFVLDLRRAWQDQPTSLPELGLPPDSFILTTVSNHLENRVSPAMCYAIEQILSRCPKAVYAPIGYLSDLREFKERFHPEVADRVIPLLNQDNPSQVARSCHIYLNEFPFGSCLGMLDAMAAGCPVVSMYDKEGPPQARYAGSYFGIEHTITSNLVEDYIALACRLIQDPEFYGEWSRKALSAYERQSDSKQYVQSIEEALLQKLNISREGKKFADRLAKW
ncbi:MAG: hypothetical protein K0S07_1121 [Chlamydiales bacterium]|jgi:glycosyltransferase involved in cell wall biosynthesis|nr:hypothetical protein [Chlamydiales bacterium]